MAVIRVASGSIGISDIGRSCRACEYAGIFHAIPDHPIGRGIGAIGVFNYQDNIATYDTPVARCADLITGISPVGHEGGHIKILN